jgi:hypothetical protein
VGSNPAAPTIFSRTCGEPIASHFRRSNRIATGPP